MATIVGKKFPDLNVDAMNEMGDTFKLNVLEEAVNNKKKVLLFWLGSLNFYNIFKKYVYYKSTMP